MEQASWIEPAVKTAKQVEQDVLAEGPLAAYSAFETALADFEAQGYLVADLVPEETEKLLGLSSKQSQRLDGKTFWGVYRETVCEALCKEKSELNAIVKKGASGVTASLVTYILIALSLPAAGALIAATIAGIILSLGVDAFCKYQGSLSTASPPGRDSP